MLDSLVMTSLITHTGFGISAVAGRDPVLAPANRAVLCPIDLTLLFPTDLTLLFPVDFMLVFPTECPLACPRDRELPVNGAFRDRWRLVGDISDGGRSELTTPPLVMLDLEFALRRCRSWVEMEEG